MSFMFATTSNPSAEAEGAAAISLSPKTPNECPGTPIIISCDEWDEAEAEPAEKDLSSPTWQYAWAEAEPCNEQDGEAAPVAERQLTEAEEIAKLRTDNQQLTNQLVQFHTVLQEHMELVGSAAAECSPAQHGAAATTAVATSSWSGWFRAAQSNEELRNTEKAAAKTAADAIRAAAETAADTAADSALASLGHPELAPSIERLIDANAEAMEAEALECVDTLIDASASAPVHPAEATCNTYSGSAPPSQRHRLEPALAEQHAISLTAASGEWSLREWATTPTTTMGYVGRGAVLAAGLAGLYAAARYGGPPAAKALGSIRERLPVAPSLLSGSSSPTTSGSTSVSVTGLNFGAGIPEVLQKCVKLGGESSMEVGHAYS